MRNLFYAFIFFLTPGIVLGQESDTTKVEPKAIPVAQVTEKAQEASVLFDEISKFIEDNQELIDIKTDADSLLIESRAAIDEIDTSSINLNRISNTRLTISSKLELGTGLEGQLTARAETLEGYRDQLRDMKAVWDITLQSSREANSPRTVIDIINGTIRDINRTDRGIVSHQDEVFKVQTEIVEIKGMLQGALDMLDETRLRLTNQIFNVDSPPIWHLERDSTAFSNSLAEFGSNWTNGVDGMFGYMERHLSLVIIHIAIFIFLVILSIYLKRKQGKSLQYPDRKELGVLFKHPIEISIILSVLVFTPPYPDPPDIIYEILILLVYAIALRLLFPIAQRRIKIVLVVIGFFLAANSLGQFTSSVNPLGRIFLLLESMIGVFITYKVMRIKVRDINFFDQKLMRLMLYFVPVAFLLFLATIITNIIGAAFFSKFIVLTLVESIALGVELFAAVLVFNGFILLLLRNPSTHVSHVLKENSEILEKRIKGLVQLIAFYIWGSWVLEKFQIQDEFIDWLTRVMNFSLGVGDTVLTVGGLVLFGITLFVGFWVAKIVKILLEKELFTRMSLPRGVPGTISTTTYYTIVTFSILIALSQTGITLTQLSIVVGALGVGIGFGLQNIISNFISGIILVYERPIQEGDTVEIGTLQGNVKSIGIRSSKVRTWDGSEVIVPNNNLISNEVINWTLSDRRRRSTIHVGVAYGTDPRKVSEILFNEAKAHPKALKEPEPLVIFIGFGDSSLDFKVHFWTYFEDGYEAKSDVTFSIHDALYAAGIEIPFPQRVVTMKDDGADTSDDPNPAPPENPEPSKKKDK